MCKGDLIVMNIAERLGLAVWVKDLKAARSLGRMGNIHYISKRLKYVYLYVDGRTADQLIHRIERLPYVQRVERSQRMKISLDFNKKINSTHI
jgi:uncharacterized protein YlbG (UPF0298 family)